MSDLPEQKATGRQDTTADIGAKTGPVLAIVATTLAVWAFDLGDRGVAIVGEVPQSLPPLTLPSFSPSLISQLLVPALLISIIGFVESALVAQTLAAKKRQRIDPDQEHLYKTSRPSMVVVGRVPVTEHFRGVLRHQVETQPHVLSLRVDESLYFPTPGISKNNWQLLPLTSQNSPTWC